MGGSGSAGGVRPLWTGGSSACVGLSRFLHYPFLFHNYLAGGPFSFLVLLLLQWARGLPLIWTSHATKNKTKKQLQHPGCRRWCGHGRAVDGRIGGQWTAGGGRSRVAPGARPVATKRAAERCRRYRRHGDGPPIPHAAVAGRGLSRPAGAADVNAVPPRVSLFPCLAARPAGVPLDLGLSAPPPACTQPFSRKSRTPTVAKECQIGLYDPAEAGLELFCNSWSAGFLGEGLYVGTLRLGAGGRGAGQPWRWARSWSP